MRATSIVGALLLASSQVVIAQSELPPPIQEGLAAYQSAGGCRAAMEVWTRAWTAESDAANRQTLIASCRTLEQMGAYHGHDVARVERLGESLVRAYVILRYESQPVYLRLTAYYRPDVWRLVNINWNTDMDEIFPEWIWIDLPDQR